MAPNSAGSPLLDHDGLMGPGSDAVLEKLTDASERWLGKLSPRVQAQVMIGAGMFVTAVDWRGSCTQWCAWG